MIPTDKDMEHPSSDARPKSGFDILPADAKILMGMVSYQAGSVVSRVVLGRKAGNVTLFAFDEEQGLSEHTAPFDALVQVLEGEAEIVIDGTAFQLEAGEIILMPANRPHALRAISRFKMLLTMIRS